MLLEVGHIDIRRGIIDFQPLAGVTMEGGDDLLGGIGDVTATRTETEIHTARNIKFTQLAILVEDGTTALAADIHHTQLRTLVSEGVAVHAAILQLFVMPNGTDIEVLHTTLLDLEMVEYLVVGLDKAIGQVGIYLVADDMPLKRPVLDPLAIDKC